MGEWTNITNLHFNLQGQCPFQQSSFKIPLKASLAMYSYVIEVNWSAHRTFFLLSYTLYYAVSMEEMTTLKFYWGVLFKTNRTAIFECLFEAARLSPVKFSMGIIPSIFSLIEMLLLIWGRALYGRGLCLSLYLYWPLRLSRSLCLFWKSLNISWIR